MLTRDGFDMIKVLKNYSAKSERRGLWIIPENNGIIYHVCFHQNIGGWI